MLWRPLVYCIATAAVLYLVLTLVFRNATKAGALASAVVFAFFYFGLFSHATWFLVVWLAVFAGVLAVLALTRRDLGNVLLIATVGAAVLALLPSARIAHYESNHSLLSPSDPRLWPTQLPRPQLAPGAPRPDVYVLIPDDYARLDVLKRYFHYDDAEFVRALTKRGFVFSEQARSPYSDSEMNIAAELNMDYFSRWPAILGETSQDVRSVRGVSADSRASRLLKSLGYRYVHYDTDEVTFPAGNPHISSFATPDSFPSLWLRQTVLRMLGGRIGFDDTAGDARFRRDIRATWAKLDAVTRESGPKFVVFHTLVPHDPYIFGQHGEAVTFPKRTDEALGSPLGMRYYAKQLQFVSRRLLQTVDAILTSSKTPPVIVIQSDEGFQASPDTFGEEPTKQVRVKGLLALHLPGATGKRVPDPPTTVNTLRFVFNRVFGMHYPLLRSASYPEADYPYQFEEMQVR